MILEEEAVVVAVVVVEIFEVEAVAAVEVEEEAVDSIENLKVHPTVLLVKKIISLFPYKKKESLLFNRNWILCTSM